jgi:hypothetical protein
MQDRKGRAAEVSPEGPVFLSDGKETRTRYNELIPTPRTEPRRRYAYDGFSRL